MQKNETTNSNKKKILKYAIIICAIMSLILLIIILNILKNNNNKDPLLIELYSDTINKDSLLKLLKQNFISLFSFQKNNNAYSSLINFEFAEIENDLKYSNDYKSCKATCDKLENALKKYVPELMRDNNEFRNAFYMR